MALFRASRDLGGYEMVEANRCNEMFTAAYKKYLKAEKIGKRLENRIRRFEKYKFDWLNKDLEGWETGRKLPSRIAVIGEDGPGDEVFYVRFARSLAERSEEVIWVHNWKEDGVSTDDNSRLSSLFERSFRDCATLSFTSFTPRTPLRYPVIFSKELLTYFGSTEEDWTRLAQNPYLTAAPAQALKDCYSKGSKIGVGLAWKSEGGKPGKSCPLTEAGWKEVFQEQIKERCSFISLQYGNTESDLKYARDHYGVEIHRDSRIDHFNMEDASMQISACDVVVSISTTAAHLAGALGKKTFLLLPADPIVHWEFPGPYPMMDKIENLSLEEAARRLRSVVGL